MRNGWLLSLMVLAGMAQTVLGEDLYLSPFMREPSPPLYDEGPPAPAPRATAAKSTDAGYWAEVDGVVYWLKPVCLVPVTTTIGNPSDAQPGVPGQPGTQVVQGGHKFQFDGARGLHARLGTWLTEDALFGVEVEGFVLEQVAANQNVTTTLGSPATYMAFLQPNNTPTALPLSIPGVVTGSSIAIGNSQMWNLDTNLATHGAIERGPWVLHGTLLTGCRYLQLDDHVDVTNLQSLVSNPAVTAFGSADFATHNSFVGAQVGSRFAVVRGSGALELTTKLACGATHLVSEVTGSPLPVGASLQPGLVPGPLLALPSNVGRSSSDRIAILPEINLKFRWRVTDHLHFSLGYNALYLSKILCPGDQMDDHVNVTQLPGRGPVVGPLDPAHKFVFTDAFAQGVEAGVGFSF